MIYWAQLLHFYQPPTQFPPVLDKICQESYRPLLEVFRQHPKARATVNINGALTEMLRDCGHRDIIEGLKELAQTGQIGLTGTGKYHPILPLIPQREVKRQIELNQKTNGFFFGDAFKPAGFFPPEMAYGRDIISPIVETGYQWIILSGVACPADWAVDSIYQVEHEGKRLAVFFRDDILSNKISFQELGPEEFLGDLRAQKGDRENIYVITAMDAETYGHHIKNWEQLFLAEVYEELEVRSESYAHIQQSKALSSQHAAILQDAGTAQEVQTVTISQLLDMFPPGEVIDPKPSSWSTSGQDIEAGNAYPLWADKDSELHRLQWEHLAICVDICAKATEVADSEESKHFADIARGLLDRAMHSDQFWWASRRPMWDINMIHLGLMAQWRVLVNAFKAINSSGAPGELKKEYYDKLVAARDAGNKIVDRLFVL
jgi:alpha-amylase/alpha-mannosidase (GH57 family)